MLAEEDLLTRIQIHRHRTIPDLTSNAASSTYTTVPPKSANTMPFHTSRITTAITAYLLVVGASAQVFSEGDSCGVTSADFFKDDFKGDYLVAGTFGCDLSGVEQRCYCAPDLEDNDRLGEWKWQCNNSVKFGPIEGKVCPATQPNQQTCDTAVNPTGRSDDPVCSYSECDLPDGKESAICACINLSEYGMGEGMQWSCLPATCGCGDAPDSAATCPITTTAVIGAAVVASIFAM